MPFVKLGNMNVVVVVVVDADTLYDVVGDGNPGPNGLVLYCKLYDVMDAPPL